MRIIYPKKGEIMRIFFIFLSFILLFTLTGCTSTQKGIALGAIGGGIVGGSAGYFTADKDEKTDTAIQYAAIGAATGAVAGAIIGYFAEE